MGILARIVALFRVMLRRRRGAREDPNAALDAAYEQMLTKLQESKRQLADIVLQQKTLERRIADNNLKIAAGEQEAAAALKLNREDLARAALMRARTVADGRATLQATLDGLRPQVEMLTDYQQKLADRIDRLRTDKETMRVSTAAAEAQLKVTDSLTALDSELGRVTEAHRRAEDKMLDARAKAKAMDRMMKDGVLTDPLAALPDAQGVDHELTLLKAQLTPKTLTAPDRAVDKETE